MREKQNGGRDQQKRQRDLARDQRLPEQRAGAADDRGCKSEEQSSEQRERGGEGEEMEIGMNLEIDAFVGTSGRHRADQRAGGRPRDQNAGYRAEGGEQKRFGQHLAKESQRAGAETHADGELTFSRGG